MKKKSLWLILTLILMLSQIFFLCDKVVASEKKGEKVEQTQDQQIQNQQISEVPEKNKKDSTDKEVTKPQSESDEQKITEQFKSEKEPKEKPEKEAKTGFGKQDLKIYSGYLAVVIFILVILLYLIIINRKRRRKQKNKKGKDKHNNVTLPVTSPEMIRAVVFLVNKDDRIEIPVCEKVKYTIGRKGKADIALSESEELADVHMALWYDQGRYWIEKQQTEKPLKFNGRELEKGEIRALYNRVVLEIGDTRYWFIEEG